MGGLSVHIREAPPVNQPPASRITFPNILSRIILFSPFPLEDSMDEQRKFAILFAATILAARKLNDADLKPWPRAAAIRDAISNANLILEEIDASWPSKTD